MNFRLSRVWRAVNLNVNVVPNLAKFSQTSTWYPHARTLHYNRPNKPFQLCFWGKKDVTDFQAAIFIRLRSPKLSFFHGPKDGGLYHSDIICPIVMAFQEVAERCRVFPKTEDLPTLSHLVRQYLA